MIIFSRIYILYLHIYCIHVQSTRITWISLSLAISGLIQSDIFFSNYLRIERIWSYWLTFIWFWTELNSIRLKIKRKTVTTIIFHSVWKEMEIYLPRVKARKLLPLVWKNDSGQTHSCPRDWRISASWGPIQGPPKPLRPSEQYRIGGFKGGH